MRRFWFCLFVLEISVGFYLGKGFFEIWWWKRWLLIDFILICVEFLVIMLVSCHISVFVRSFRSEGCCWWVSVFVRLLMLILSSLIGWWWWIVLIEWFWGIWCYRILIRVVSCFFWIMLVEVFYVMFLIFIMLVVFILCLIWFRMGVRVCWLWFELINELLVVWVFGRGGVFFLCC